MGGRFGGGIFSAGGGWEGVKKPVGGYDGGNDEGGNAGPAEL